MLACIHIHLARRGRFRAIRQPRWWRAAPTVCRDQRHQRRLRRATRLWRGRWRRRSRRLRLHWRRRRLPLPLFKLRMPPHAQHCSRSSCRPPAPNMMIWNRWIGSRLCRSSMGFCVQSWIRFVHTMCSIANAGREESLSCNLLR